MAAPHRRKIRRRILIALLLLLLFMAGCSILEGSAASLISITFQQSEDIARIVGNEPISGGSPIEEIRDIERPPSGQVPSGTRVTINGAGSSTPPLPPPGQQTSTGPNEIQSSSTPLRETSSAVSTPSSPSSPSSSSSSFRTSSEENVEEPLQPQWILSVMLRSPKGIILQPQYHFEAGQTTISIDDRRFTPGFYTLLLTRTNAVTGEQETVEQEFPWGVLAMNTDADRYRPGEEAQIAIGVLDEYGAIVCDADLLLTAIAPSGITTTLSTAQGTIRTTGTCGLKIGGLLTPDYEAYFTFAEEGTYTLHLVADRGTESHAISTMESEVHVMKDPPIVVSRIAATRLWPVEESTMEIRVFFREAFTGDIEDRVPLGFVLSSLSPVGAVREEQTHEENVLRWNGSWAAGETAIFSYTYDAPDISPEFYLIGPLELARNTEDLSPNNANRYPQDANRSAMREQRSWQIANDDVARSTTYDIPSDTIVSGGGETALSDNYLIADTLGEPIIGPSTSTTYTLDAGYRQMDTTGETTVLALSCDAQASIPSIIFTGNASTTFHCTVQTTNASGYNLSWQVATGSGGTATGSLIDKKEETIPPYSPSVANVPEAWSIDANEAAWGGRLRSASTDTDVQWGTDTTSEKWLNVGTGSTTIVQRSSATELGGSLEQISVRVEIGASAIQPNGEYQTTITMTASAL